MKFANPRRDFSGGNPTGLGLLLAVGLAALVSARAAELSLEAGFQNPPESTKPWVYWYWISDNISKEGITRDLEAMARAGIGEALIGNVDVNEKTRGAVKVLTEEWWGMVEHAIREGGRVGVNIGLFNCPGWSQSGGPWVKPEQAMRRIAWTETRVQGPAKFAGKLAATGQPGQDLAVLAFRAPAADEDTIARHAPRIRCQPEAKGAGAWLDGNLKSTGDLPAGLSPKSPLVLDIEVEQPFTARSLVLHPAPKPVVLQGELQVATGPGQFKTVRAFTLDRHNPSPGVGFMPYGPLALSFEAVTARQFRLVFMRAQHGGELSEIEISGAARLEKFVEKQLAKMHQTPLPMWDTYLWQTQPEPEGPGFVLSAGEVLELTSRLQPDGTLNWDIPAGEWVLLRLGLVPTGTRNSPASPEGSGLEIDKMNRAHIASHFEAFIGHLLRRMPAAERRAFRHVVADSYEMGSQNWTDGFGALFQQTYGYDLLPWLPVLTGRLVGGADQSERFLWDLRRLVADRVAYDYVGGLREECEKHGLRLWLENYGHWGFPSEFLKYGGQTHDLGGEFWATGDLGSIELRAAASAAHIYGKPVVSAEAFTGGPAFVSTPWSLKRRGDWAWSEGINHFVLHVYIHQPDERRPGINAWFGTEFNRHNTWFEAGRAWVDYLRRSHFLLQQGQPVADVAYFIGEDAPKMTGARQPELPPGYDFDYINAEVIEQRLRVVKGQFTLPSGTAYRLLVLPELETMRPGLLRKIRDLVAAGGAVLGTPPSRSPSRQNYPACDDEVKQLAAELWAGCDGQKVRQTRFGQGRVFRGMPLAEVLRELPAPPDLAGAESGKILWKHRATAAADIYFLSNQSDRPLTALLEFRVQGKTPELWDADSGRCEPLAVWSATREGIKAPVPLEARGSVFVVFRQPPPNAPAFVQVERDGRALLTAVAAISTGAPAGGGVEATNTFTMAGWVKPAADLALPKEADAGVFLNLRRNDVIFPAHGSSKYAEGHAGAGLSAGRNGVVVYEHSAGYFAPLLVHMGPLTEWTHVAVVYQNGQPQLFLDGVPARRGLKSRYLVHPTPFGDAGPGGPFKGESSEFQIFDRALAPVELAALVKAGPPAGGLRALPVWRFVRPPSGGLAAEVSEPGVYRLKLADGWEQALSFSEIPAAVEVAGPWAVRFPVGLDVPEQIEWQRLVSWAEHSDAAIRHFSGTAAYVGAFDLGPSPKGGKVYLDLGRVESLAEVRVNGKGLGTLWKPPFVTEVTAAVRPGRNTLEVRVTNTWRNRLVGAKKHPDAFPGGGPLQFKPHLAVEPKIRADDELLPAGLLGPVRVIHTAVREVGLKP